MDPPVVLRLFGYGPEAGVGVDGQNEIDVEFSQWDGTAGDINADFTLYPSVLKKNGASSYNDNFKIAAPSATSTTVRYQWSAKQVTWTIMAGTVPIGSTQNVLKTETYSGTAANIPQSPMPVGINLWSYQDLPTHPWNIVISDFQIAPQQG